MTGQATAAASLRALASAEGRVWADSPSYDAAEANVRVWWPDYIWPLIQDRDFSHVVDLAAGHGRNSEMLRAVADRITVVDINQENVDFCKQRFAGDPKFRFFKNDGCGLPDLEDGSVSLVYCFDAMVHFDSDVVRAYLREFARVLKPGGRGFCRARPGVLAGNALAGGPPRHPHGRGRRQRLLRPRDVPQPSNPHQRLSAAGPRGVSGPPGPRAGPGWRGCPAR
jgi:SAM-dependent methyltransferase